MWQQGWMRGVRTVGLFAGLGLLLVSPLAWADEPEVGVYAEPAASEAEANLPPPGSEVTTRGVGGCPPGFQDLGMTCGKPRPYGRGTGYAWKWGDAPFDWTKNANTSGMMTRCRAANPQGCEIAGSIAYPRCREGYVPFGSNICTPRCPQGMRDLGAMCSKPEPRN